MLSDASSEAAAVSANILVTVPVSLPKGTLTGPSAFWKHVYDTVRTAAPFPLQLEESIEAVRFSHLMKKTSPFGK